MVHSHGFGSRGASLHVPHAADDAALEDRDAIGARRAVRKGSPPDDAEALSTALLRRRRLVVFRQPPGAERLEELGGEAAPGAAAVGMERRNIRAPDSLGGRAGLALLY